MNSCCSTAALGRPGAGRRSSPGRPRETLDREARELVFEELLAEAGGDEQVDLAEQVGRRRAASGAQRVDGHPVGPGRAGQAPGSTRSMIKSMVLSVQVGSGKNACPAPLSPGGYTLR